MDWNFVGFISSINRLYMLHNDYRRHQLLKPIQLLNSIMKYVIDLRLKLKKKSNMRLCISNRCEINTFSDVFVCLCLVSRLYFILMMIGIDAKQLLLFNAFIRFFIFSLFIHFHMHIDFPIGNLRCNHIYTYTADDTSYNKIYIRSTRTESNTNDIFIQQNSEDISAPAHHPPVRLMCAVIVMIARPK